MLEFRPEPDPEDQFLSWLTARSELASKPSLETTYRCAFFCFSWMKCSTSKSEISGSGGKLWLCCDN